MTSITEQGSRELSGSGGRRRRRRSSLPTRWRAKDSRSRWRRVLSRLLDRTIAAPWFATTVLGAFLCVVSADFLILLDPLQVGPDLAFDSDGSRTENARRDAAQAVKADVGIVVYGLTALLCLAHLRAVLRFHGRSPHFLAIIAVLLLGMLWSDEPIFVLTSTIQIAVGTHLAIVFALTRPAGSDVTRALCSVVLIPLFVYHAASIALFFFYGFDFARYVEGQARFGGIAGGPNSLGGQGVLGLWAALTLALRLKGRTLLRVISILAVPVFLFGLAVSGSGTALIASLLVSLSVVVLHFISSLTARVRHAVGIVCVFVLILAGGAYALNNSTDDLVSTVTGSVGKDATFTGRTELWGTALAAIKERPLLGWSFDDHATVYSVPRYEVPFNHYHNGFLDTLVAGGILLGALVLYELIKFVRLYGMASSQDALLFVPLLVLVLLNLSEYSLLRPLSSYYVVFQCAWCLFRVRQLHREVARH